MPKPKLEFLMTLGNTRFNRALDASQAKVISVGRRMAAGLDPAIKKLKLLRATAAKVATVGIGVGAAAGVVGLIKLNGFMRESIGLANEQKAAESKLAAVIKATGGAAGFTAGELGEYASKLQDITTYGDEVTISAMAILATFKQIKGDEFKRATVAAQDMSTIMNTDLNSSIALIGKALNDPIKGVSALNRVGVTFTETQTEMITKLQKSGDLMGAQSIILKELEGQFGGAAKTARDEFGGELDALGDTFGDYEEEVGFAITQNQFFHEGLKLLGKEIKGWTTAMKENGPEVKQFAKETAILFLQMGEAALTGMDYIYRGSQGIAGVFQQTAAFALDVSGGIFKIVQAGAALTDFLGITENATDEWKISAEAAFGAAEDLSQKADKNFEQMADGAPKIQQAREALEQFRTTLEKIPATGVGDISKDADDAATATDGLTTAAEKYELEMVEVNGVWQQQKKAVQEVNPEIDKIITKLQRLQNETITINLVGRVAEARRLGGMIGALHMSGGGGVKWHNALNGLMLPGFGGGDRRHIIGEDGEVMIKKESVRAAGGQTALDFNAGRWGAVVSALVSRFGLNMGDAVRRRYGGFIDAVALPPVGPQMMAGGGSVVGGAGSGITVQNLNINVSSDASQATIQNAKKLSMMVMNQLEKRFLGGSR